VGGGGGGGAEASPTASANAIADIAYYKENVRGGGYFLGGENNVYVNE